VAKNGSSRIATRKEFLEACRSRLQRVELDVPELECTVLVWELTGPEKVRVEEALTTSRHRIALSESGGQQQQVEVEAHPGRARLLLVSLALKDDDGKPLYSVDDLAVLPARAFERIHRCAETLSAVGDAQADALGKGSRPTATGDDSSRSPSPSVSAPSAN
jgi:hypothetical protein